MRLTLGVAGTAMLAFGLVVSAHAQTEDFTVTGTGISGSGTITVVPSTTSSVSDALDITGISGTFSVNTSSATFAGNITGLFPGASYNDQVFSTNFLSRSGGNVNYDDLLFPNSDSPSCNAGPTGNELDACGLYFQVADGSNTYDVNLFGNGSSGYLELDDNGTSLGDLNVAVSFTPAATPEPSSIALLGTGLLGFAGTIRRRFKK